MMLFGEKYPDPVRMVSMGEGDDAFSRELCGGTHLESTAEVGRFEILSEEGVSAGTRRITAITGKKAEQHAKDVSQTIADAAELLGCSKEEVPSAVSALLDRQRELKKLLTTGGVLEKAAGAISKNFQKSKSAGAALLSDVAQRLSVAPLAVADRLRSVAGEVEQLGQRLEQRASAGPLTADALLEEAEQIAGVCVVIAEAPTAEPNLMRQLIDQVRRKADSAAVLLASRQGDDKVTLVAGISKDLQDRGVSAGKWIGPVAKALGGGGGGRPDMAQAGGKQPEKLPEALEIAKTTIAQMLG